MQFLKVQRKLLIEFYITFFPCRTSIGGYWWCLPEWCLLMVLPWSTTHWGTCTALKRQASMHLTAAAGILSPLHVQMLQMCLPPQGHQVWMSKPDPKRTPEDQLQTHCSGSHKLLLSQCAIKLGRLLCFITGWLACCTKVMQQNMPDLVDCC